MTDKKQSDAETDIIEKQGEIVFLFDARDCNPNSDPLSPTNRPRIDQVTNQCVVTEVRLKRYFRNQLRADGHGVYIADTVDEEGYAPTREYLATAVTNVDSPDDISDGFLDQFLDAATDVRYFGSTLPFSTDDDGIAASLAEHLPRGFTGPIQFLPGRSIHPVRENKNYDTLSSVIATGEGKEQGAYGVSDKRIVYGLIGFSGVINRYSANGTRLSKEDVSRLDTLCWRAIKYQANSRSKTGQHPRLYLRVTYEGGYHIGNLDTTLELGSESKSAEKLTNVTDATVDITTLIDRLKGSSDRIQTITIAHDPFLELEGKDDTQINTNGDLKQHLEKHINAEVTEFDPAEAHTDSQEDATQ